MTYFIIPVILLSCFFAYFNFKDFEDERPDLGGFGGKKDV